jgi:hypothetical protein
VIAIVRGIRISKNYDPIFVTLTAVWACYQVQSLISINQIGLAIWGWLLTGILISHQRNMQNGKTTEKNTSKESQKLTAVISPGLLAMLGVVAGFLVSWPALNSDAKFFAALNSKDAAQIEAALTPSLVNPASSSKYTISVDLFMRSNLLSPALKYAREAVKFNPDSFDSWRQLYFLDNSMPDEKTTALQNMKRLDPRNPDVLSTS